MSISALNVTPHSRESKETFLSQGLTATVLTFPCFFNPSYAFSVTQLVARSLRLLQASGVPLDPSVCLSWGRGTAATAVTVAAGSQGANPGPKGRRAWRLIEALEARRLRVSIEAFPIARELEPPSYSFEVAGEVRARPDETVFDGRRRRGLDDDVVEEHREMEEEEEEEGSVETDGSESNRGGSLSGSEDEDGDPGENEGQKREKRASGYNRGSTDGGHGGDIEEQEVAVDPRPGHDVYGAPGYASQIYDPCFLLPLVEWALRTEGVTAQAVSVRGHFVLMVDFRGEKGGSLQPFFIVCDLNVQGA